MKTLTLLDFKNQVAREQGFTDWNDAMRHQHIGPLHRDHDVAAERYANYRAEEAAKAQRIICAANARMTHHCGTRKEDTVIKYHQVGADNVTINKDSILNAQLVSSITT